MLENVLVAVPEDRFKLVDVYVLGNTNSRGKKEVKSCPASLFMVWIVNKVRDVFSTAPRMELPRWSEILALLKMVCCSFVFHLLPEPSLGKIDE